jgi:hypothetical protein
MHRAHSFGQFKKHALLKVRTQSPCFSYPGLARAFKSAGLADLSSFGGVHMCSQAARFMSTQKYSKVAEVHATARRFGHEGLV